MSLKIKGHTPDQALTDAITRWGLDPKDPQLRSSVCRLTEAWGKWAEADRWMFLSVVEAVAEGERWKGSNRRRPRAYRYATLRATGLAALKLAERLLHQFPPDIASSTPPLAGSIATVASLGVGCVLATGVTPKINIHPIVNAALTAFRTVRKRVHWELMAEIVSLAVGRQVTPDAVRRYLSPGSFKAPGFAEWKKHEELIASVVPYADPLLVQSWIAVGLAFLAASD